MLVTEERSEKHDEARGRLPEELHAVFDELVADYRHAATIRHGSPFVSYAVLADLVEIGWRFTEAKKSAADEQEKA